jgi:hypothetical protein
MSITEFILLMAFVAILDLIVILWLRKRKKSNDSKPKAVKSDKRTTVTDRLKDAKKGKTSEKDKPELGIEPDDGTLLQKKAIRSPHLIRIASALESFPDVRINLPRGD